MSLHMKHQFPSNWMHLILCFQLTPLSMKSALQLSLTLLFHLKSENYSVLNYQLKSLNSFDCLMLNYLLSDWLLNVELFVWLLIVELFVWLLNVELFVWLLIVELVVWLVELAMFDVVVFGKVSGVAAWTKQSPLFYKVKFGFEQIKS